MKTDMSHGRPQKLLKRAIPGYETQAADRGKSMVVVTLSTSTFDAAHLVGLTHDTLQFSSQAVTIWDGEQPLCCFGISSPWPGLGFAWCAERDPEQMQLIGRRIGLTIARTWRQWLTEIHYQRIESRAPETHAAAQRLLRWLGFQQVSVK